MPTIMKDWYISLSSEDKAKVLAYLDGLPHGFEDFAKITTDAEYEAYLKS